VQKFDGKLSVSGDGMPNVKWTNELTTTYTLLFGLKVDSCPPDNDHVAYIFGHTGVGGYGLRLRGKNEKLSCTMEFLQIGSDTIFDTG